MIITIELPDHQYQDMVESFKPRGSGEELNQAELEENFLKQIGIYIQSKTTQVQIEKKLQTERERITEETSYSLNVSTEKSNVDISDEKTDIVE